MSDDAKKKLIIGIAALLIVLIIVYAYFSLYSDNYNRIKKDKNNYLVYSKVEKEKGANSIYIPYLNIDSEASEAVNKDIDSFTSEFIDRNNCYITYEYDISGIVLSLVLKVKEYQDSGVPIIYFRSYNMSLETLELISDDSLLDFYSVSEDYVSSAIEDKFREHYVNVVNEKYYDSNECDYDCFLVYRGFEDYLEDIEYYVENGNLIVFKPFNVFSFFGEEEYFKEDDFKILIKES